MVWECFKSIIFGIAVSLAISEDISIPISLAVSITYFFLAISSMLISITISMAISIGICTTISTAISQTTTNLKYFPKSRNSWETNSASQCFRLLFPNTFRFTKNIVFEIHPQAWEFVVQKLGKLTQSISLLRRLFPNTFRSTKT